MPVSEDEIDELKSMVMLAKRVPLHFAMCFGKKPEGAVVLMDKKLKPEMLGKNAKKAGETNKICTGILSVEGKNATLKVEGKPPSGVAKHLLKFFKGISIPLVFELQDAEGNVLPDDDEESEAAEVEAAEAPNDVGDATGADPAKAAWEGAWDAVSSRVEAAIDAAVAGSDKIKAVMDFALGKAAAADFPSAHKALQTLVALVAAATKPGGSESDAANPKLDDAKALVERLKTLKTQIAALSGAVADQLNALYVQAVTLMKSADLAGAGAMVDRIETSLQKASSAPASTKAPDPRLAKVGEAADKLRSMVDALPASDGQGAMSTILDAVTSSIAAGEAEAAVANMKRVQEGLKLQAEVDRLAPLVAKAASSGKVADVNALNLLFNMVAEKVPAADLAGAMANLAKVEAMIAAGATGTSTFETEIPADVRPIALSQLEWVKTRSNVRSEIGKLQAAIIKVCNDVGDLKPVIDKVGALLDYVAKLDERLEDKLNEVVNAPPGASRDALKQQARGLLAEYQSELAQPFFADVDSGNGFADVAVASSARTALAEIANALAA